MQPVALGTIERLFGIKRPKGEKQSSTQSQARGQSWFHKDIFCVNMGCCNSKPAVEVKLPALWINSPVFVPFRLTFAIVVYLICVHLPIVSGAEEASQGQ